ncbi:MAG: ComEA family DNA-binding protein [Planctomycetota bacterium]
MRRVPRLLVAWALLVYLLAIRAFAFGVLAPAPEISIQAVKIDLNRASVGELQALPGLGPRRAEAIVLERIRRGPFRRLQDLRRVAGVGPVALRALAPHVEFGAATAEAVR